jgi:hypothetical protein
MNILPRIQATLSGPYMMFSRVMDRGLPISYISSTRGQRPRKRSRPNRRIAHAALAYARRNLLFRLQNMMDHNENGSITVSKIDRA